MRPVTTRMTAHSLGIKIKILVTTGKNNRLKNTFEANPAKKLGPHDDLGCNAGLRFILPVHHLFMAFSQSVT